MAKNSGDVTMGKLLIMAQAERLRKLRVNHFKSATDAAKAFNIPPPTYLSYENGTRKIPSQRLAELARKFGSTTDYLLSGVGEAIVGQAVVFDSALNDLALITRVMTFVDELVKSVHERASVPVSPTGRRMITSALQGAIELFQEPQPPSP